MMNIPTNINWDPVRATLPRYTWQQHIKNCALVFIAVSACTCLMVLCNKSFMGFLRDYHWSQSLSLSLLYGSVGLCALVASYVIYATYTGCKNKASSLQEVLSLIRYLHKDECLSWQWDGENREA